MAKAKTIVVDGVEYAPVAATATKDGKKYVIVRTHSAGVFAGYLESQEGQEVILNDVRRLWYWDGAASLSQLAVDGVSKPENCKFAVSVSSIKLLQAIEILDCTTEAQKSILGVSEWKA